MIKMNKIVSFTLLGICSILPLSAKESTPKVILTKDANAVSKEARDAANRYAIGYLEREKRAETIVRNANEVFNKADYSKARDLYLSAQRQLKSLNPTYYKNQITFCVEQINLCYYELAQEALAKANKSANLGDYDEAIRLCKEAKEKYPKGAAEMDAKIKRYIQIRKTLETQSETSIDALDPDRATKEYEIQILMRRGREFVTVGLYQKAKRMYEEVLLIDPWRADALQNLKAVNTYINRIGNMRTKVSHNSRIVASELEWALPISPKADASIATLSRPEEKSVQQNTLINNKLKSIIIPSLQIEENMKLGTAIKYLVTLSRENDPEKVGINIVLRQDLQAKTEENTENQVGATTETTTQTAGDDAVSDDNGGGLDDAGAGADEFSDDDSGDDGDGSKDDEVNFTPLEKEEINLPKIENTTLENAIKSLCTAAKLRFRVDEYAVILEPLTTPASKLETKIFPVSQNGLGVDGNMSDPNTLKNYFIGANIDFPVGAKVVFLPKISRIVATNTLENLVAIEALCEKSLNVNIPLIQLQLRVVEISQNDLHALGFQYTLSNSADTPLFDPIDTGNVTQMGNANMNATATIGEFSLGVDISAISQLTSADTLASPRITTVPNHPVSINLTQETYFVDEYDEAEQQTNQAEYGDISVTYIGPFPNFESEATPLGIQFSIPEGIEVDTQHRLITMRMQPKITALTGWTIYEGRSEEGLLENMKTPIISERSIATRITISDGDTVVLGGIIEDTVNVGLDKVPLLGDIPLLGRLFQTRSRQSAKKSMLIFVTPRLVKTDGSPYYSDSKITNKGVASFF